MLGTALTLRPKTVDGVYQEIWGTLIAYNLIRLEIAKAALTVKCEPTEVSFISDRPVFFKIATNHFGAKLFFKKLTRGLMKVGSKKRFGSL